MTSKIIQKSWVNFSFVLQFGVCVIWFFSSRLGVRLGVISPVFQLGVISPVSLLGVISPVGHGGKWVKWGLVFCCSFPG